MFQLTEKQQELARLFVNDAREDCKNEGAIGGRFSYIFTPTSLGTGVVIKDNIREESLNLTDYEDW